MISAGSARQVSAVVCTRDAAGSIEPCLRSLRENFVGQIVVVDASSTDGTRAIAERLADVVVTDQGEGLGAARNLGLTQVTGAYVLNGGADNVFPRGSIAAMVGAKEHGGYHGVSAVTYVPGRGYRAWAMRRYRAARFPPGERAVIGTPTLFDAGVLRSRRYDPRARHSDDAELCERLQREIGARFAIADVVVDEIGQTTVRALMSRYRNYGISDAETYARHRAVWTRRRRCASLAYPLRVELLEPLRTVGFPANIALFAFVAGVTTVRYASWIRASRRR